MAQQQLPMDIGTIGNITITDGPGRTDIALASADGTFERPTPKRFTALLGDTEYAALLGIRGAVRIGEHDWVLTGIEYSAEPTARDVRTRAFRATYSTRTRKGTLQPDPPASGVTILVRYRGEGDFMAFLAGKTGTWETGRTDWEAVGNFFMNRTRETGVNVAWDGADVLTERYLRKRQEVVHG